MTFDALDVVRQPRLLAVGLDRDVRGTPQDLFDRLNARHGFTLDVCALPENAKCERFFTIEDDGLAQDWAPHTCWCNPPYSDIRPWVEKAIAESRRGARVVMLLPAATDTKWFHELAWEHSAFVDFLKGRLRFEGQKDRAPFASMIVGFGDVLRRTRSLDPEQQQILL